MKVKELLVGVLLAALLAACVNQPRNYIPAGFKSIEEVRAYLPDYLYYAVKITREEWSEFYQRFPEYWQDLQLSKQMGGTTDLHPWYTAYAFKWTGDRRSKKWDDETIKRLDAKSIAKGDDVFKVIYAKGVPARVVSTNDFELLVYRSSDVLWFKDGTYDSRLSCGTCWRRPDPGIRKDHAWDAALDDAGVIETLGLMPPKY